MIDLRTLPSLTDLLFLLDTVAQTLETLEVHGDLYHDFPLVAFPNLKMLRSYSIHTNLVDFRYTNSLDRVECYLTWFAENIESLGCAPTPYTFKILIYTNPPTCHELLEDLPKAAHTHAGLAISCQDPQKPLRHNRPEMVCCEQYYAPKSNLRCAHPKTLPLLQQAAYETLDRYQIRVRTWNQIEAIHDGLVKLPVTDLILCGHYFSPAEVARAAMLSAAVASDRCQQSYVGNPRPDTLKIFPLETACVNGIHARMINDIALGHVSAGIMATYKDIHGRNNHPFRTWEESRTKIVHSQLGHWWGLVKHLRSRFPEGVQGFHCSRLATVPVNSPWFNITIVHKDLNRWFMNGTISGVPLASFGSSAHQGAVISNYTYLNHHQAFSTYTREGSTYRQIVLDPHTCAKPLDSLKTSAVVRLQDQREWDPVEYLARMDPLGGCKSPLMVPHRLINLIGRRVGWGAHNVTSGPLDGHRMYCISPFAAPNTFQAVESRYIAPLMMYCTTNRVRTYKARYAEEYGMFASYETAPASYWGALNALMFGVDMRLSNAIYSVLARAERSVPFTGHWQQYDVHARKHLIEAQAALKAVEIMKRLCGQRVQQGQREAEGLENVCGRISKSDDPRTGPFNGLYSRRLVPVGVQWNVDAETAVALGTQRVLHRCMTNDEKPLLGDQYEYPTRADGTRGFAGVFPGQDEGGQDPCFFEALSHWMKKLAQKETQIDGRYLGGVDEFWMSYSLPRRVRYMFSKNTQDDLEKDARRRSNPLQWLPAFGEYDNIMATTEVRALKGYSSGPDQSLPTLTERLSVSYIGRAGHSNPSLYQTMFLGREDQNKMRRVSINGRESMKAVEEGFAQRRLIVNSSDLTAWQQDPWLRGLFHAAPKVNIRTTARPGIVHQFEAIPTDYASKISIVDPQSHMGRPTFSPSPLRITYEQMQLSYAQSGAKVPMKDLNDRLKDVPAVPDTQHVELPAEIDDNFIQLQPYKGHHSLGFLYEDKIPEDRKAFLALNNHRGHEEENASQVHKTIVSWPPIEKRAGATDLRLMRLEAEMRVLDIYLADYNDEMVVAHPLPPTGDEVIQPQKTVRFARRDCVELEDAENFPKVKESLCWFRMAAGLAIGVPEMIAKFPGCPENLTALAEYLQTGPAGFQLLRLMEDNREECWRNDLSMKLDESIDYNPIWTKKRAGLSKKLDQKIEVFDMMRAFLCPNGRFEPTLLEHFIEINKAEWPEFAMSDATGALYYAKYLYWVSATCRTNHPFTQKMCQTDGNQGSKWGWMFGRSSSSKNLVTIGDSATVRWRKREQWIPVSSDMTVSLPKRADEYFKFLDVDVFKNVWNLHRLRHLDVMAILPHQNLFVGVGCEGTGLPLAEEPGILYNSERFELEVGRWLADKDGIYDLDGPIGELTEVDDEVPSLRSFLSQKDIFSMLPPQMKRLAYDEYRDSCLEVDRPIAYLDDMEMLMSPNRDEASCEEWKLLELIGRIAGGYEKEIKWFVNSAFTQIYDVDDLDKIVRESEGKHCCNGVCAEDHHKERYVQPTIDRLRRDHDEVDYTLKFNRAVPFKAQRENRYLKMWNPPQNRTVQP